MKKEIIVVSSFVFIAGCSTLTPTTPQQGYCSTCAPTPPPGVCYFNCGQPGQQPQQQGLETRRAALIWGREGANIRIKCPVQAGYKGGQYGYPLNSSVGAPVLEAWSKRLTNYVGGVFTGQWDEQEYSGQWISVDEMYFQNVKGQGSQSQPLDHFNVYVSSGMFGFSGQVWADVTQTPGNFEDPKTPGSKVLPL